MDQNGGKVLSSRDTLQAGGAESCVLCHGKDKLVDIDVKHGLKPR